MDETEKNFQDELRSQMFRNSFRAGRGYRSAIAAQSDMNAQLNNSIQGGLQRRAEAEENRKRRQLGYDQLATDAGLRRRGLDIQEMAARTPQPMVNPLMQPVSRPYQPQEEEQ